ncbi:hypothetical protein NFI96_025504 [Prochilodus magdalenae]|nr:hypothetical protein NFI96_025504 [Prochilodus magdalenae]
MSVDEIVEECVIKQHESLNISHRGLVVLPARISKITCLKRLLVNDNYLILPPDEKSLQILQLERLEELILDGNQLTMLPSAMGALKHLTYLGVSRNPSLLVLPEALGELGELRELWAVECSLISIPQSIGKLTKLRKLGLNNNSITTLPPQLGNLKSLQWLNLADNRLHDIPEDFTHFQSLVFISLNKNRFEHIPKALTGWSCLHNMHTDFVWAPVMMQEIQSLQVLLMAFNSITSLEDDLILGFSRLIKLDLRQNPLKERPHHWKGLDFILLGTTEGTTENAA